MTQGRIEYKTSKGKLTLHGGHFDVSVEADPKHAALLRKSNQHVPSPQSHTALIDTGSQRSLIKLGLPAALGMKEIDKTSVTLAHGKSVPAIRYMGQITFENGKHFLCSFVELSLDYDVIIGRNILAQGLMTYDGTNGVVTLAFDAS